MKKYILLSLVLFSLSCKTTSKLGSKDISKLNGRWEVFCFATFDKPDEIACPMDLMYKQIKVDVDSGIGEEVMIDGFFGDAEDRKIKVFKKGKKLMITYYLLSGEKEITAEIIKLDEEELIIKVEEKQYYLISERAPSE